MKILRKLQWAFTLSSAVLIALGIFCIVRPGLVQNILCYVAGALLMVFGIAKVVRYFASRSSFVDSLIVGVLLALIGFVLITQAKAVISLIFAFIGILILLDGIVKLKNAFDARAAAMRDWVAMLVFSVIVIAFGVLVIANPFEGASVPIIILGVSLLVDGLQNLYTAFHAAYWAGRAEQSISPADRPVSVQNYTVDEE